MIKEAEVQNAYLMGRQAAMEKIANPANPEMTEEERAKLFAELGEATMAGVDTRSNYKKMTDSLGAAGQNQLDVLRNIGLSGQGLTNPEFAGTLGGYDPRQLATMENLSRLGMLGGAAGGAMINPSLMGAGASTAGALGGGLVGGNLGQAIAAGLGKYDQSLVDDNLRRQLMAGGGALGGLAGGLGAGYMS